jgi:hypothetical protein
LVLKQEEAMWFQKSRTQWIKDGDRNTQYYHVKTITRRRKNKIMMLKNHQNEWVENEEDLKEMVNNYYKNLFARPDSNIQWQQTRYSYPTISELDYDQLKEDISNVEIKSALFAMDPWKAPGPDGFPAGFYQNGWCEVGSGPTQWMWLLSTSLTSALYRKLIDRSLSVSSDRSLYAMFLIKSSPRL